MRKFMSFTLTLVVLLGVLTACTGGQTLKADMSENDRVADTDKDSGNIINGNDNGNDDGGNATDDGPEQTAGYDDVIPLYTELWRPAYHFTDKNGFINDPNGLCYLDGTYHIYYQLNPEKNYKDGRNVHWGHATSTDLVHFQQQAPVLAPDASGAMWSGTAYVDTDNRSGLFSDSGGGIIAAYSTHTQKIGIAYSADGFNFTKLGIVINNTTVDKFRDPKLFYDEISDKWTMIIAGGTVRFYQSSNLKNWICVSVNSDILTECPDFFELTVEGTDTKKWVLSCANRAYYVGEWDGTSFVAEEKVVTASGEAYAGITFANEPRGRVLMMKWQNSWKVAEQAPDGIWSGSMTLVNELSLRRIGNKYVIVQTPIEEYASIIGDELVSADGITLGTDNPLSELNSQTYVLDLQIAADKDFSLNILQSENEEVAFSWSAAKRILKIDRSKNVMGNSVLSADNPEFSYTVDSRYIENGILSLVLYVDTSCCDYYICGGIYVGNIRYQPLPTSRGASLVSSEDTTVKSLSVRAVENIRFGSKRVNAVLTPDREIQLTLGKSIVHSACDFYGGTGYKVESLDESTVKTSVGRNGITVEGIAVGETLIKAYTDECTVYLKVKVYSEDIFDSDINTFSPSSNVNRTYEGYAVDGAKQNVITLSDISADDFSYGATVKLEEKNGEAGLIFRALDASNYYVLTLNLRESRIRLSKVTKGKATELYFKFYALETSAVYGIEIVAQGSGITVYVDEAHFCTVEDTAYTVGYLGLSASGTVAVFNRIRYERNN